MVTEGPTPASNYLKAGAPFSEKAKAVAKNLVLRFDITILRKVATSGVRLLRSGDDAFALMTVKRSIVGPSAGRVVDWSESVEGVSITCRVDVLNVKLFLQKKITDHHAGALVT